MGKEKTHVALALAFAFATLACRRRARVLVLTHSRRYVTALQEVSRTPVILFASYDTLKRFHNPESRRRTLLGALKFAYVPTYLQHRGGHRRTGFLLQANES